MPFCSAFNVDKVAIRTYDFQLGFRLMKSLKNRKIPFILLDADKDPVPNGLWLGTESEVLQSIGIGKGIGVSIETIDLCIERVQQILRGLDDAVFLTFGVDPGPRPGLAWLADGVLIGSAQIEKVDDTVNHIRGIASVIQHDRLRIKIGNGSPVVRNRLVNLCIAQNYEVIIVNEKRTTRGPRVRSHETAAARIAMLKGRKTTEKLPIEVTEGEIREWQRRSRKFSNGRFTISGELAKAVAVGRFTLDEAILIQERRTE
tara:strand:- start:112 stop:888 length:777 start_codon:yes stop_codon:yes gene_type:complete